jgi:hypothetical protein
MLVVMQPHRRTAIAVSHAAAAAAAAIGVSVEVGVGGQRATVGGVALGVYNTCNTIWCCSGTTIPNPYLSIPVSCLTRRYVLKSLMKSAGWSREAYDCKIEAFGPPPLTPAKPNKLQPVTGKVTCSEILTYFT